ncbi:replication-associated recombination protein A [Brevibacterium yomogidense]|uniref:replication-associated recombination protein A n=1 Tax=Brevibacterium yomogidense TaxID=946573 RepID=UPI001E3677CA|nr:replication-associated recombination protein A [Brevibacterium yomogidense]
MRPRTLEEVVGQEHLTFPGSPLRQLVEARADARTGPASVILWGPPGVGKTTLAHVISHAEGRSFVELSAITAGVRDVRHVIDSARTERELHGRTTVLFLDEIHRFTKAQQDALLPAVENRLVVLVAATTENPSFSVIAPLLSRSLLLTLRPLDDDAITGLLDRAVTDPRGLAGEYRLTDDARSMIVRVAGADARRSLTVLEAAAGIARARGAAVDGAPDSADSDEEAPDDGDAPPSSSAAVVTEEDVAEASAEAVLRYDRDGDQHYDVVSAFIKSIRGSDPDAALHYLARMIVAGEDPRFICRRVVISAAEDVGMADPHALTVAVSAHQAVERIGMPEGRIPLAEAVVYLATAPKSPASYRALDAAIADVKAGRSGQVPLHLRDAHYPGAKGLGHGEGYLYSHDWPYGVSPQEYLPDTLRGTTYYQPTANGAEARMADRLASLEALRREDLK